MILNDIFSHKHPTCENAGCPKPATRRITMPSQSQMYLCDFHVGRMIALIILEQKRREGKP